MIQCPVCNGHSNAIESTCLLMEYSGKMMKGFECIQCGLIRYPDNLGSFQKVLSNSNINGRSRALRNANDERPGREFYMAEMGLEVLGKKDASISFFGSGMNTDHLWVKKNYPETTTKLIDLENLQEVENFENIADATPSDVVIAAEVIEHFTHPIGHFQTLLRLLSPNGILICSSNIYDGTDISTHLYPFMPGHVAYWTPLSLIKVASDNGCFIDFRTPEMGLTRGGPRKKYIIFYRSTEVLFRLSLYFGRHMHAPSEKV